LIELMGGEPTLAKRVFWFLLPGYQALFWYRLSRWLYLKHWRSASRLLFLFSIYWTRIEIPPTTAIGAACFLGHAPMVLCGRIGERFTHYGDGGTGGGMQEGDIGGGPDLPVIGNDVVFAIRAMALGPIHIGDGARLGPTCTVTRDVPAGAVVAAAAARILARPEAAHPSHSSHSSVSAA
jgi:serine O-acetyltransferase